MSRLVNATRQYDSLTANGAVTHSTSLNYCLDLFFLAGASRRMLESDIILAFDRARAENKNLAYKIYSGLVMQEVVQVRRDSSK
jgi:hypothetical protein